MFHSARIKLTAWYLLIIMVVSLSFSGVIYKETVTELERGFRVMALRHQANEMGILLPRIFSGRPEDLPPLLREAPAQYFLEEDFWEAKKRVLLNLLLINGAILVFSTLSGYFLAGKTLRPIEKSLEEQKRFIADASHELRTPLTALRTSMEVSLRDTKMPLSEAKTLIKSNLEEVVGLQSLSDKLLSLACFQGNGHSLNFKEVDIAEAVGKVTKKILPLAKEKEIKLAEKVGSQIIWADEENLQEMLWIFLDNSVKYTPRGGKVIIETKSDKKWLIIKVEDTGIGIAEEDLPYIFDRFYRADQSRSKEEVAGFGLGLSLAKKIIEMHKGTIGVSSVLGKKTIFTIRLPLKHS